MALNLDGVQDRDQLRDQQRLDERVHAGQPFPAGDLDATRPTTRARRSPSSTQLKSEGKPVDFTLGTTPDAASVRAVTYIQSALQTVGINANIGASRSSRPS